MQCIHTPYTTAATQYGKVDMMQIQENDVFLAELRGALLGLNDDNAMDAAPIIADVFEALFANEHLSLANALAILTVAKYAVLRANERINKMERME
jgi:hypothetical protein